MYKEIGICVLIIIVIFILDAVTLNYLENTILETTQNLQELKDKILADDSNDTEKLELGNKIYNKWLTYHHVLSIFIEHNELEKVETEFSALIGNLEGNEYSSSVSDLNQTVYILNHIARKYKVSLDNIF